MLRQQLFEVTGHNRKRRKTV